MRKCKVCDTSLLDRQKKFCSNKCQADDRYIEYIKRWKLGEEDGMRGHLSISNHIRRYLFQKYDSKCCECGWGKVSKYTKVAPLEVEHIDGNHKNNCEENLKLLCPNCHSLTATYRNLNKGFGRNAR